MGFHLSNIRLAVTAVFKPLMDKINNAQKSNSIQLRLKTFQIARKNTIKMFLNSLFDVFKSELADVNIFETANNIIKTVGIFCFFFKFFFGLSWCPVVSCDSITGRNRLCGPRGATTYDSSPTNTTYLCDAARRHATQPNHSTDISLIHNRNHHNHHHHRERRHMKYLWVRKGNNPLT